jgi:sulfur-oxidizing protein SoxZ
MSVSTRALIHLPPQITRGSVIEIRTTLGHAMETGHRRDSDGRLLPRDIATRFECRLNGALVFGADLYPAIAANPYIAFPLRTTQAGELVFLWTGDNGFRHQETRRLDVA